MRSLSVKNNVQYFLHCHYFFIAKEKFSWTLLSKALYIYQVKSSWLNQLIKISLSRTAGIFLLFGSSKYGYHADSKIKKFSVDFILKKVSVNSITSKCHSQTTTLISEIACGNKLSEVFPHRTWVFLCLIFFHLCHVFLTPFF